MKKELFDIVQILYSFYFIYINLFQLINENLQKLRTTRHIKQIKLIKPKHKTCVWLIFIVINNQTKPNQFYNSKLMFFIKNKLN